MLTAAVIKTLALAGNPNSGKTTLFNALTGLRQKTGNYPGVTVEKRVGKLRVGGPPLQIEKDATEDRRRGIAVESANVGTLVATAEPHDVIYDLIDLPGTYSLISNTPDEKVAVDVLTGQMPGTAKPDAVIVVVDASNLQRNLYLVSQLIEMQVPMVIALNMMDIAERRGIKVQAELLQAKLGVPVVPVVGHKRRGLEMLKRAIPNAAIPAEPDWPLPVVFQRAITLVSTEVVDVAKAQMLSPRACAERLLVGELLPGVNSKLAEIIERQREQLITAGIDPMQADVEAHYQWIDGIAHAVTGPTVDLRVRGRAASARSMSVPVISGEAGSASGLAGDERDAHATKERHAGVLEYAPALTLTERVDRILLHKVWGLLAFVAIMAGIFMAIFFAAAPLMDATEGAIGWIGEKVAGLMSDGPLKDMWTDAIVAGVGGVLVFVPQIAILFGLLAILEDSGYLARAAFIMDRLLGKVGLSGKAFVPLLSGFACAIPGVMASRTIANPRDRLRTIFVLPFMSCSARLPVYTLLIGAFFAANAWWVRGGIMLGLYLLGIIAAFGTAWVWKSRSREATSSFLMELPSYKLPQALTVARVMFTNTKAFVTKAGTIIFALSVVLWATTYWPRMPDDHDEFIQQAKYDRLVSTQILGAEMHIDAMKNFQIDPSREDFQAVVSTLHAIEAIRDDKTSSREAKTEQLWAITNPYYKKQFDNLAEQNFASAQLRYSLAGRFGHLIEPVIKPLGFDWKMGVGMVGAFGAREVFVSTMGIVYAAGDSEDDPQPLESAMQSDRHADGSAVWTPLIALNMLVWFVLAMQCLSTVAIVKRETGGCKWPLLQLAYMNGLAYTCCLVIYQVGRALGA